MYLLQLLVIGFQIEYFKKFNTLFSKFFHLKQIIDISFKSPFFMVGINSKRDEIQNFCL